MPRYVCSLCGKPMEWFNSKSPVEGHPYSQGGIWKHVNKGDLWICYTEWEESTGHVQRYGDEDYPCNIIRVETAEPEDNFIEGFRPMVVHKV